jgi:mRNA interferase MazF
MALSTALVAPDLGQRSPGDLPPDDLTGRRRDQVLVEQTMAVDPERLGRSAGRLDAGELREPDEALALIPRPLG